MGTEHLPQNVGDALLNSGRVLSILETEAKRLCSTELDMVFFPESARSCHEPLSMGSLTRTGGRSSRSGMGWPRKVYGSGFRSDV